MKKTGILLLIFGLMLIFVSCQKTPTAAFTVNKTSAGLDETITFTNSSTDGDHYEWDFGDGKTSAVVNPTHSYSAEGNYTVKLTAYSKNGKKSSEATIGITVKDTKLEITVVDIDDPTYYVEGIDVEAYTSFSDWENLTNVVGTATTNSSGKVTFSKCSTSGYYIDVAGYDNYEDYYDNYDLGYDNVNYIFTGTLTFGVTNTFTAYVEWDPLMKNYKIVKLERTNSDFAQKK